MQTLDTITVQVIGHSGAILGQACTDFGQWEPHRDGPYMHLTNSNQILIQIAFDGHSDALCIQPMDSVGTGDFGDLHRGDTLFLMPGQVSFTLPYEWYEHDQMDDDDDSPIYSPNLRGVQSA